MSYSPNIEKVEIVDNATGRTVELDSNGNAALILNADQDNDGGEVGSPFVRFLQDGALTSSVIGHAQAAGTKPNGGAFTDGLTNALVINSDQTNPIQIGTNSAANITVLSGGNVGIGTNAPSNRLDLVNGFIRHSSGTNTGYSGIQFGNSTTATNNAHIIGNGSGIIEFYRGNIGAGTYMAGMGVGGVYVGGTNVKFHSEKTTNGGDWANRNILVNGNSDPGIGFQGGASAAVFKWWTGGNQFECRNADDNGWRPIFASAFNVASDYRLKTNIQPVENATALLSQMTPCKFTYTDSNQESIGFIAHELQSVVPHAVSGSKDAETNDGTPIYQGVDLSKLVPILVKSIQELKTELDAVKTELAALKG